MIIIIDSFMNHGRFGIFFESFLVMAVIGILMTLPVPARAAAPVISSITGNNQTVFAREAVNLSAAVTDDGPLEDLIFIWSFGDTESDFGDSNNASTRGLVTHYYDRGATGGRVYNGQLRVIDRDGAEARADFSVTVNPLRSPVTENRDQWPFAHITRPGEGPYAVGQTVRFSSGLSEPGLAGAGHDSAKDEWRVFDSRRAQVGDMITGLNLNFSFENAGYYRLWLRVNQVQVIGAEVRNTYDYDSFVFEVTNAPARVANQEFSVSIAATPPRIDINDDGTMAQNAKFKAVVAGGTPNFIYNWSYPPNDNSFTTYQNGPTASRESDLQAPPPTITSNITFTSPGTKPILVSVQDSSWRKIDAVYNFVITNPAYPPSRTFSPPQPTTVQPQPLALSLVQDDNMPLQNPVTSPNLSGTVPDQTYKFRAIVSGGTVGGTTGYTYNWSTTGRQGSCASSCTYVFNKQGSYQVKVDVSDSSAPVKTASQSLTVVIGAVAGTTGGAGTTGTTGGTAGGTTGAAGGTGGETTGGTAGGTGGTAQVASPSASRYGLNSSFNTVSIGQNEDLKGSTAKIVNIVLGFLGILAVIIGLYGGFQILTASGNEDKVAAGRKTLIYALIGLVVVFVAWGIAQFVISNLIQATA